MTQGSFLFPQVTSLPGQGGISQAEHQPKKQEGVSSEFDQVFGKTLEGLVGPSDLNQIKVPLKFSAHAAQRLRDRKIALDSLTMSKVGDALDKAEAKGIEDTLVLTQDAALIVNVKNRTVITALDRNSVTGNVFTNIDGAVIL